jgi:hypothetical protein
MQQLFALIFLTILVGHIPPNKLMLPDQSVHVINPWRTVTIHRNCKLRRKKVHALGGKIPFYTRVQNILNHKYLIVNVQKGKTHRKNVQP